MLLKFIDTQGKVQWVNPEQVSSAEPGQKKDSGEKYTVLHMASTSKPKIIVKEPPEEINKIFAKYLKREFKLVEV